MGAAMQVGQPTQRGRVSKWGSHRNGGQGRVTLVVGQQG